MRFLFKALAATVLALALAASALLWAALDAAPTVAPAPAVTVADIDRALRLLQRNDPRGKLPGIIRSVSLTPRDLGLLITQAGRRYGEPRVQVQLHAGSAQLLVSLPLPANPVGAWLNLDATLRETAALPTVERLAVGRLRLPGWLAEAVLPRLLVLLDLHSQSELARRMVSQVVIAEQQLTLRYAWPANPQQDLAIGLLAPEDRARLDAYTGRLAALSRELAATGPVSLARLMPPVFALARERSTDNASAVRENRAALMALAFLVNDQALQGLVRDGPPSPPGRPMNVTLLGRRDTPQHFLVSAALSAKGGGALADAIGLYKEVADSHGGSGFSFNDLAADRAGTRLGLLAVGNPLAFQARLAAGVIEADLMPAVGDLPESLTDRQFRQRFGGVGAPAYRQMLDDIEQRLNGLTLLQAPP
jgi:hypothetical protein